MSGHLYSPPPMRTVARLLVVVGACLLVGGTGADPARATTLGRKIRGIVAVHTADVLRGFRAVPQAAKGSGPLAYHGGPVMHSSRTHAIYWDGGVQGFPAGYQAQIDGYLTNVGLASGARDNVHSILPEYPDQTPLAYASSFGGSLHDPNPYPLSGCVDTATPGRCLTDAQLQSEIAAVIDANGLPTGLGELYLIFTPPGVGSCVDLTPTGCAYVAGGYCAYHADFSHNGAHVIYANLPDANVDGCRSGQYPNGSSAGADPTIDVLSHEHNEAITDPLASPGAWFDSVGLENGDKCSAIYGDALGSTGSGAFNQRISSGRYYIQQEYSNSAAACVSQDESPLAGFASSSTSSVAGQAVLFDARASSDPDGAVTSVSWDFGDGTSASGRQVTHAFTSAGSFAVRASVVDSDGGQASSTHSVAIAPVPAAAISPPTSTAPTAAPAATPTAPSSLSPAAAPLPLPAAQLPPTPTSSTPTVPATRPSGSHKSRRKHKRSRHHKKDRNKHHARVRLRR